MILIITAFSKIIWSYMDSGQAGLTIVVPALLGLMEFLKNEMKLL
ncbi:hypothetical protein STRMA_1445 [Streptococcus macacae NCTC 11558]|uniref:Uncharacterized protein n=1 Tax=Streptococcus macacae NCTC 11558 TaxID=764298 RepID=G5JW31_9STRE|nr:hypothetical protein STRMA_1445 [Streptococcus macacae NCTC 11558]